MYSPFMNSNGYGDMGLNLIVLLSKIFFYQVWLVVYAYNPSIPEPEAGGLPMNSGPPWPT